MQPLHAGTQQTLSPEWRPPTREDDHPHAECGDRRTANTTETPVLVWDADPQGGVEGRIWVVKPATPQ